MSYTFNPFTSNLDAIYKIANAMIFKGEINVNSDFPTSAEVQNGWTYTIGTDVTDNDASKTNTGQSFLIGDEIAWNGTDWTIMGNELIYVPYTGATQDVDLGSFDLTTTGSLTTPKINSNATQDLNLFGDTDVGDDADGKTLIINRKATEGDTTLSIYNDKYKTSIIESDNYLRIQPYGLADVSLFRYGNVNQDFRQYGYITADTNRKYINWQVSDTDDYFHLTRQDDYVKGFKIEMPVDLVDNDLTTTGTITGGEVVAQDRDILRYTLLNS